MWRSIGTFLNWVSQITERWARHCGHPGPPLKTPKSLLRAGRMGMRLMAEEAMKESLARRARNGRNQAEDNKVVAPMNASINEAIVQGDFRLAAEIFRENYTHILTYEKANPPCEIHKGAITFDVARAYLQGWDFFAAMHYFELAERETQLTTANKDFSIYNFDLFEKNFWDAVQVNTAAHPIPIYNDFWQTPYNKQNALDDYSQLSQDSKLAYIIASAERVRLQNIADHSGWEESNALRLGYWTLAADLARLLEVEAKRRYKTVAGACAPDTITIALALKEDFQTRLLGTSHMSCERLCSPCSHEIRLMATPRRRPPTCTKPTSTTC